LGKKELINFGSHPNSDRILIQTRFALVEGCTLWMLIGCVMSAIADV